MVDITQVNADDTVENVSLNNIAFGTDLQNVRQITITDANGNALDGTDIVPTATEVEFDYGDMILNNIKFGAASLLAVALLFDNWIEEDSNNHILENGDNAILEQ